MWHMYVTEDGQNLVVIEENLYYFNNGWNQDTTQYFYPGPESLDYNGDAFQTGKELAFATAEECFTQAKETLSQLGIAVADSYDCFTLDSETLQAEAEKVRERLVQNGVGLWTDEAGEPLSREESLASTPFPSTWPARTATTSSCTPGPGRAPSPGRAQGWLPAAGTQWER